MARKPESQRTPRHKRAASGKTEATEAYKRKMKRSQEAFNANLEREKEEDPETYAARFEYEIVVNPNGTKRARPKGRNKQGTALRHVGLSPIPLTPENRANPDFPICGSPRNKANVNGPGVCCLAAGWGTNHNGYGRCKYHGGNTPSGIMVALKERLYEESLLMYGNPIEIDPGEALLLEVKRTAGHVQWLGTMIQLMGPDQTDTPQPLDDDKHHPLVQWTDRGVEPSVWIKMYQDERSHLVRVAKMAIDSGIAQRQVEIAEQQGMQLALIVRNILTDPRMALTPAQQIAARDVVRQHMTAPNLQPVELSSVVDVTGSEA